MTQSTLHRAERCTRWAAPIVRPKPRLHAAWNDDYDDYDLFKSVEINGVAIDIHHHTPRRAADLRKDRSHRVHRSGPMLARVCAERWCSR